MKTEKLTLKHLAPYLPYGLIIRCGKTKSFDRELTHDYFDDDKVCVTAVLNVEAYKPILRPLSGLTKDEKVIELLAGGRNDFDKIVEIETIKNFIFIDYTLLNVNDYLVLLENHFDVFGLIDKGLAIDINKLEDEIINKHKEENKHL